MTSSVSPPPLLIQVVPRLMPGRCGVSDQAVLLAQEFKTEFGIDSAFAVLNSTEQCSVPYPTVYCPATSMLENCLELTQGRSGATLIHMSGYGYSADGAPTMLANALDVVRASGRFRAAAYFHEIYAVGPPWKSVFWHTCRQKKALSRIVAQCGLVLTSIEHNARWLSLESQKHGGVAVEQMPVFSPAGETDAPFPFTRRNPALVVFGLRGTRELAYSQLSRAGNLLADLDVEEILDIGPDCNHPLEVNGIPLKPMGRLAAEDLAPVFSQTRFGFVSHEWSYLARSSVLAAYCSQGVVPVVANPIPRPIDGLADGVNIVGPRTAEAVRQGGGDACSRAAWNWYMGHRLHVHAERYARWLREPAFADVTTDMGGSRDRCGVAPVRRTT